MLTERFARGDFLRFFEAWAVVNAVKDAYVGLGDSGCNCRSIVNEKVIAIEKLQHDMIEKLCHAVIVDQCSMWFKWRILWLSN